MEQYSDSYILNVLERTKTIALVGASLKPMRASNRVGHFLASKGYRVIPVNPGHVGENLFGEKIVAKLADIDIHIDMVDIFRRSEAVEPIVHDALEMEGLQTIWMQLGVVNEKAAQIARNAGIDVVMDRCPKIEYPRLISP